MSRSVQKIPCRNCTDIRRSDRRYKKMWHQCLRSRERVRISVLSPDDFDAYVPLLKDDVANIYASCKDDYTLYFSKKYIDETAASFLCLSHENKVFDRLRHRILGK
jgi:hypothetical protein